MHFLTLHFFLLFSFLTAVQHRPFSKTNFSTGRQTTKPWPWIWIQKHHRNNRRTVKGKHFTVQWAGLLILRCRTFIYYFYLGSKSILRNIIASVIIPDGPKPNFASIQASEVSYQKDIYFEFEVQSFVFWSLVTTTLIPVHIVWSFDKTLVSPEVACAKFHSAKTPIRSL